MQEEAETEVLLDLICHRSFDQFWWVGVIFVFFWHNKWHKKQHVVLESNQFSHLIKAVLVWAHPLIIMTVFLMSLLYIISSHEATYGSWHLPNITRLISAHRCTSRTADVAITKQRCKKTREWPRWPLRHSLCLSSGSASFRGLSEGQLHHNATRRLLQMLLLLPVSGGCTATSTSRSVDRNFRGPGRQKSWRKGKTSGDATRLTRSLKDKDRVLHRPSSGPASELLLD